MGLTMIPMLLRRCAACSGAARRSPPAALLAFGPTLPVLLAASPARTSTSPAITLGADRRRSCASSTAPRKYHPAMIGALLAAVVRDQGDDVHHGLRDGLVLPRSRSRCRPARRRSGARCSGVGLGGLGLGAGRLRGRLHAALHDVPDAPRRALGRHLHGPEVLARPAGRRPRRRAAVVLHRRADRRSSGRRCCFGAIGAVSLWQARARCFAAFLIWDFLLSLGRLLVGGREVRLAACMHPLLPLLAARRRRPAGDLAGARRLALRRASRPRRSRSSTSASPRGGSTSTHGADPRELLVSTQSATEVKRRRRPGAGAGQEPRPGQAAADRHGRRRRGRDVPLRLVLPPPADAATSTSSSPTPRRRPPTSSLLTDGQPHAARATRWTATTGASTTSASGGCATTRARSTPATGGTG